ncbi:secretin and TonB N terminus short domain protein [Variovorax sp. RKNM96]|uniref:secretin and TonB N-terminal domain-containing protein n=1 Tax=Variovorax sp. RKNM96 TaxID=2681552 RepID=UPI00197E722F|nr:secretin and TonB N-terminal domain-containing protein [Variovorax sp. RKNM96]QSI31525.1 secretin and TonB N terminus short domain protein [Variovorax sp. RKNM96]
MTRTSASGGALTLSWCLVVALMMAARMAAAQAVADGEPVRFDLPAQPLEISLSVFGRITGHSVLVVSSLTAGREAAAVQGDFVPREALQRMLAGSGLAARYIGADAFTLVPVPSVPSARERADERVPKAGAAAAQVGYAAVLQASITRVLCIAQPDAFGRYRLALQIWIDAAGLVNEARLIEGSGLAQRDALVLATLGSLQMDAPPPPGMAQPVTILLTPRADPARDCRPWRGAQAG